MAKFFPETYGRRKDGKPSVWKKFDEGSQGLRRQDGFSFA